MRRLVPTFLTMTANTFQGVKGSTYALCDGPWQTVCLTEVYLEHVETLERRCGKKSSVTTYLSWLACNKPRKMIRPSETRKTFLIFP